MNKVSDWSKPIKTITEKPARLLGVLKGRECGYHVAFEESADRESWVTVDAEGKEGGMQFIINVPERTERWVNVYEDDKAPAYFHDRKEDAIDARGKKACLGLVKLTIEDGKLVRSEVVK